MPVRITLPTSVLGLELMPITVVDLGPLLARARARPSRWTQLADV